MQEPRRLRARTLVFPLFIALLLAATLIWWKEIVGLFLDRELLRAWILARGSGGRLAFAGLQALQVIVFVIPGEVVQVAGGYIYGFGEGIWLSVAGITAGSLLNFLVGRLAGRPFVEGAFGRERLERIEALTASGRASAIFFLLFVIPGIPKDALCYAAGISRLRFPAFFLISLLGRLPGIAGSAVIGARAQAADYWTAFIVLAIAIAFLLLGLARREKLEALVGRLVAGLDPKKTGTSPGPGPEGDAGA